MATHVAYNCDSITSFICRCLYLQCVIIMVNNQQNSANKYLCNNISPQLNPKFARSRSRSESLQLYSATEILAANDRQNYV